jgi:hypothetical protein
MEDWGVYKILHDSKGGKHGCSIKHRMRLEDYVNQFCHLSFIPHKNEAFFTALGPQSQGWCGGYFFFFKGLGPLCPQLNLAIH